VVGVDHADVVVHNSSACQVKNYNLAHVLGGHGAASRIAGKSRFRSANVNEIKHLIRTTVKKGKGRSNTDGRAGRIYEHDFGRQIGRDTRGRPTSKVRVVLHRRKVKTAHPY
jgi:hypothetical protein